VAREGLRALLARGVGECTFQEAASYEEAVEHLATGEWDLALLDVDLPGRSGLELLGEIRRKWPSVPVLVVSASHELDLGTPCLRRGAAGYVCKKGPAADVLLAVQKVLGGGHYVSADLAAHVARLAAAGAPRSRRLSAREFDVLRLVAKGLSLGEVAAKLGLSEKTVATYRARVGVKLGLSSNVELTRYALKNGLAD